MLPGKRGKMFGANGKTFRTREHLASRNGQCLVFTIICRTLPSTPCFFDRSTADATTVPPCPVIWESAHRDIDTLPCWLGIFQALGPSL